MIKCKHRQAICKTLYAGGIGIMLVAVWMALIFDEIVGINLAALMVGYGVLMIALLIEERTE